MREAEFKWIGPRPVDDGEIEAFVREDMRRAGVNMCKPHRLIFSTVVLTEDFDGPVVHVTGGKRKFHASYEAKAKWVSLSEFGEEGGAA